MLKDISLDAEHSLHHVFLHRCISIDLEMNPDTRKIFDVALVPGGESAHVVRCGSVNDACVSALLEAEDRGCFLLGHNLIHHDLVQLKAADERLARIGQAPIDTLWLNPLAFPQNPYQKLVKHYQDGRLQAAHRNDPELDARLVFEVLTNQLAALTGLASRAPDLMAAYHWLTTRLPASGGVDAVFRLCRKAGVPDRAEAQAAIRATLGPDVCPTRLEDVLRDLAPEQSWPLAYAMAWISACACPRRSNMCG
ncbi:hypothetical protein RPE78_00090 [Thioclava litoralis]|uniref:Uncharacterized protein n=1 Tax=Thioclava litoralis TaxID=3076557 RepID=A0ABZ1E017_9RHOB|nr:hypothetical protein RPE78_00090 [Thioclava sp. FTW29]